MKPLTEFLADLASQDVKLWIEDGRLLCDAPQGVLTADLRQQLAARKPDVIAFLQHANQVSQPDPSSLLHAIPPLPSYDQPLPLSFAQERLWFLAHLEPDNTSYNILGLTQLSGSLNIAALERVIAEIIRRHAILRTSFSLIDGQPRQVIHPTETPSPLIYEDQRQYPLTDTDIHQRAQQELQRPFDLSQAPLVRFTLLQQSDHDFMLIMALHHIISDGWSTGILIQELTQLYPSYCQDQPSPLAELAIQYADFAVWQRQWLQGDVLDTQLNYWKDQLANAPAALSLPTDRPRPAQPTYLGKTQTVAIDPDLSQPLQQLSLRSGTTLFMTLLAAFATLLYRYTGTPDLLIGSPIANRNRPEIEPLIGFFVNTLVLRTRFEDNPRFSDLLQQVRDATLAAYDHQDLPFAQIVEALQPERSLSYSPLFQVMFALQNPPEEILELPNVTLRILPPQGGTAKFDLTLTITDTATGLVGSWEYKTDLFDDATIARMANHFQVLLAGIVANPEQRVDQLPLLTVSERHQLLMEWNQTARAYPQDQCIHHLIEAQVDQTPTAIAIRFGDAELSYEELNRRANQVAHHLQILGVGPEVLVGICLERSLEMVIGLLGILKAGGAYVPLDPNYPHDRLQFMIEDAKIPVLLTQTSLLGKRPNSEAQVICMDRDLSKIDHTPVTSPPSEVNADNLAYVIYTSGSTGKPKGVQIEHQSVVNFLYSMQQTPGLKATDRLAAVTTLAFDIAGLEIYLPLTVGAQVVIMPQTVAQDGHLLQDQLHATEATILQATPATWQMLLAAGWANPSTPMTLLCGGEALSAELAKHLLATGSTVWNLYGPTEATIWSTQFRIDPSTLPQTSEARPLIPIGQPIANTQIYILDAYLNPVPIGVPGELHIGGSGLARGYLNRPDLTAETFIPNPFGQDRLYKTGDLARYLIDGTIEFLGRLDHQVKIRGFRIELGEIETVLSRQEQVQQCVVMSQADTPGDQRLVAYVVSETDLNIRALQAFLKQHLPDYMVPALFVQLGSLPLTPNGKVDRKALPKPDRETRNRDRLYAAPRTPQEAFLCSIFAKLLKISAVGVHDSFFDLGGHSLLGVQLMAQIQSQFQVQIPLAILFQSPTVAQLAQLLDQAHQEQTTIVPWPTLVPIQPQGDRPPLFVVPGAGGNVIYLNSLAQLLRPHYPVYGLQPRGLDGLEDCDNSVDVMARRYIDAIRSIQPHGPYYLAGHSFGSWVAYEMAQQLQDQGEPIGLVIAVDTVAPRERRYPKQRQMEEWQWLAMVMKQAEGLYGRPIGVEAEVLKQLPDEAAQYNYTLTKLIEAGILPEGTPTRQLRGLMKVYKLNNQTRYEITPDQAIKVPLVLVRSEGGFTEVTEVMQEEWFEWEDWGWQDYSSTPIEVIWVPGDHHTMMASPQVNVLAQQLSEVLEIALTQDKACP